MLVRGNRIKNGLYKHVGMYNNIILLVITLINIILFRIYYDRLLFDHYENNVVVKVAT